MSLLQVNKAFRSFFLDAPETQKRIVLMIGGRGSGKSRAIAQKLAVDSARRRRRVGVVRKVRDNIRDSQHKELHDAIAGSDMEQIFTFTTNPLSIRVANGSEFICKGMDDAEKVKSLAEVEEIWIEELTEISLDDFTTLDLGLRGAGQKRIICSCNPINSWVREYFFEPDGKTLKNPEDVYYLHTTYLDNRFRGPQFDRVMERLRERDPQRYKRDAKGEWVDFEGLIYSDYTIIDAWPEAVKSWAYGTDFGYNDPMATVRIALHERKWWIDEILYETGLDSEAVNVEWSRRMGEHRGKKNICDSSRPEMIAYLGARGWNVHPSHKGKGSVRDGISLLQSYPMMITRRSVNWLREVTGYTWIADRKGNIIDEPVDYDNHAMDATRYGAEEFAIPAGKTDYKSIEKREYTRKLAY